MSLFGSSFTKPAGTSSFGGFGNIAGQQQQQQQQNPGTPSLFGGFGSNTNQQQAGQTGTAPATSGSLFGGNASQPSTTGSTTLFGSATGSQPASTGTSLFGNTTQPSTGGSTLFGTPNTQQQQGNSTLPSGGLFGSTNAQQTNAPAGGGLFGNSQTNTGGGLFGQNTTNNAGGTGTTPSLFGGFGQNNQQNQQTSQPSTSLFGGFGQNNQNAGQNQQQPQQTNSLFGGFGQNAAQNQQGGQTSSLFSQPQQQQGGLFGQPTPAGGTGLNFFGNNAGQGGQQSSLGMSGFGQSTTSNLFGNRSTIGTMPMQRSDSGSQVALVQRIESIMQAWDPSSPQCRFQHFFYNLVEPNQVQLYARPANATNDALWQKAVRENPDPSCFVPALAVGFDDLQKRVEAQKQQAAAHQERIKELKARISNLSSAHSVSISPRLQRATAHQTQLMQRLVRLCQHLHLLIPSVRSSSIRPEEEVLRSTLESLEDEIKRPGGTGRLKGKLSELWALIGALEAAKERDRRGGGEGAVEWAVVDPEGLQRIAQILSEQQTGLSHLTKIVQSQLKDLDIIYGKDPQERDRDAFSTDQASQVLLGQSQRRI